MILMFGNFMRIVVPLQIGTVPVSHLNFDEADFGFFNVGKRL
jgi:hypothetical protein